MSAGEGMLPARLLLRNLALFLLLNGLVLNGALWLAAPAGHSETVLHHTRDLVLGRGGDDSWGAMNFALGHIDAGKTTPLYTEIFFNANVRFQYPPSALFALSAMRWLAPERLRTSDQQVLPWPTINDALGWIFIALTLAATAALLELGLRQRYGPCAGSTLVVWRAAVVVGLGLTFYPLVKAFTLGQIQVWLNGLAALALLGWATGRRALGGVLVGLICLVKPHYGLVLLWSLLRREWRFAAAAAATLALGLAAAVAAYGFANHLDYLRVLAFLAERGEAYYPNQSANGLLNRLMGVADPQQYRNLDFLAGAFPPYNRWVYGLTLATSLAIIAAALLRRRRAGDPDRIFDFATILVTCTIASPIAWEHHYGILLPVYAILLANALGSPARLAWLAASYALASNFVPVTNLLAPTVLNVAQSHLFAGALVALVLLHLRPLARDVRQSPSGDAACARRGAAVERPA
jgi:alpha-1,2-mannosyltransferase